MTITHVVETMEVGGAETLVNTLCRLLRQAGHYPEVHCLVRTGPLARLLEQEGIPVTLHACRGKWPVMRSVYKSFRTSTPDIVHCHNAFATTYAAPPARLAGAGAVISTRHGLVGRPPHALNQEILFWLSARLCCARVVAVCEAARNNLMRGPGAVEEKVITIRNGAAPATGDSPGHRAETQGFTLVTVARLAPPKDHVPLLHAVALLRKTVPGLRLLVVGDGVNGPPLSDLGHRLGRDQIVQFVGESNEVGKWLASADLFVLPSYSEGIPISLLEAMAAGLPLVVSDVGGMPEIARMSGAGEVVPPGRPDALAAAIHHYALRRQEFRELAARSRACYQEHFTPERMLREYLQLYQQCLNTRSQPAETSLSQHLLGGKRSLDPFARPERAAVTD